MSGIVVPILPYTIYNYAYLTGATEEIVIADRIPVAPFAKLGLSVRQHRKNIATGGSFQFIVRYVNPSDRDGADFVNTTTPVGSTAAISGVGGATLLELSTGLATLSGHPMVRVVLSIVGSTANGLVYGVFSADMVLRTSG